MTRWIQENLMTVKFRNALMQSIQIQNKYYLSDSHYHIELSCLQVMAVEFKLNQKKILMSNISLNAPTILFLN